MLAVGEGDSNVKAIMPRASFNDRVAAATGRADKAVNPAKAEEIEEPVTSPVKPAESSRANRFNFDED